MGGRSPKQSHLLQPQVGSGIEGFNFPALREYLSNPPELSRNLYQVKQA
jgi:hypothetical protein